MDRKMLQNQLGYLIVSFHTAFSEVKPPTQNLFPELFVGGFFYCRWNHLQCFFFTKMLISSSAQVVPPTVGGFTYGTDISTAFPHISTRATQCVFSSAKNLFHDCFNVWTLFSAHSVEKSPCPHPTIKSYYSYPSQDYRCLRKINLKVSGIHEECYICLYPLIQVSV